MPSRRSIRGIAAAVLLACALLLGASYAATGGAAMPNDSAGTGPFPSGTVGVEQRLERPTVSTGSVADAEHVTVVATQGFYVSDEDAELVAVDADGNVLYYNDTYRAYFDVDPVDARAYTVEYVAAQHHTGPQCAPVESQVCTRNVVERVNLSTGETTRVYAELTSRVYSSRWHDVDRVNDTHLAVADIVNDRVYVVDTRSGETTWQWNASQRFARDQGGRSGDWTHINDVEVLDDGRVMVSVRNMDQVVFVEPGEGANDSWTLGTEDDYEVLYEQHNPDYIPAERGGPAVLVSDSENNRVVEYQRANGAWERAWQWRDARLQWPRDADRLPNGHTLVVDSHGDRVLELDENGATVWNVTIGLPYDAERLDTGDESTGPAWRSMHGQAGHDGDGSPPGPSDRAVLFAKSLLPNVVVNGLLYVSPSWIRFVDLLFAAGLLVDLFAWGTLELYWSRLSLRDLLGRLVPTR